jgi:cytochrome b561
MQNDTQSKLSTNTVLLHWVVAIMMLMLLITGIYMEQNSVYALYPWHKSFGVLIALFVVLRVLWRLKSGWPPPVRNYLSWEQVLSKIVHYLLIIGTLVMPISGFMMSALGGHGVALFGLELVARNPDLANPEQVIPLNEMLAGIAHTLHGIAGYCLLVGILLHIVGALKHHLFDKDGTLRRMLGMRV